MKTNFQIRSKDKKEFLQLLNRAATLSNQLEETLNKLRQLKCTCDSSETMITLDVSEGSTTSDILSTIIPKLEKGLRDLL